MRLVLSSPGVTDAVRSGGGSLYVWTDPHRCCSGGVTFLKTGARAEAGRDFRAFPADGFDLFFDPGAMDPPDELHLEVKGHGRRRRVEAYWNGCVYAL